ncbi:hypothetical protein Sa4125_15320 [Aureimonas sp. SA4125]|nr:hypothetical protein Sa4125_15320 [Aureimonas sp. SA4125]
MENPGQFRVEINTLPSVGRAKPEGAKAQRIRDGRQGFAVGNDSRRVAGKGALGFRPGYTAGYISRLGGDFINDINQLHWRRRRDSPERVQKAQKTRVLKPLFGGVFTIAVYRRPPDLRSLEGLS